MKNNKFIVRPKGYKRLEPSKDSRKIYIYCEGDREDNYFKFFVGLSSNISIISIPSKDGKSDPEKLLESAQADFKNKKYVLDDDEEDDENEDKHDSVWFVIDTDQWGSKITTLRDFCNEQNAPTSVDKWFVTQSNPCFEIWLYYHSYDNKPRTEDIKKYASMKDFVNTVIPGGFDSRKKPALIENAIGNAKKNYKEVNGEPDLYSTEVYKLGELILPFVKSVL